MSLEASSRSGNEDQPKTAPRRKFDLRAALLRRWDRWVRTHFTTENVIAFLKTMAWVAPLTLLIWIYAEQELEVNVQNVPVKIQVKCSDPTHIATVSADEQVITVDATGPQSNVDRFRESDVPLVIDIGNLPSGVQQVPTLQALADNPQLRKWGISVEKCLPPVLSVTIDTISSKRVPVTAPPGLVRVQHVQFHPDEVDVHGPSAVISSIQNVVADNMAALPDLGKTGDHTDAVALTNQNSALTLQPVAVTVSFTVTDPQQPLVIPSVPIFLFAPKDVLDAYKITYTPFLSNLHVIGPEAQLASIQRGDVQPIAQLEIDKVDPSLANHDIPVVLKILNLTDGVQLDPKYPAPQVTYSATER